MEEAVQRCSSTIWISTCAEPEISRNFIIVYDIKFCIIYTLRISYAEWTFTRYHRFTLIAFGLVRSPKGIQIIAQKFPDACTSVKMNTGNDVCTSKGE